MAKQTLNNEESGSVIRGKINDNFTEVYSGAMTFTNSIRIGSFLSSASQAEEGLYLGNGAGVTTSTTTSRRGNVAIGTGAMASLTNGTNFYDGAFSVAVGYQAMNANTTGGYNTAVGYKALATNQTDIQNSAFGYFALRLKTAGGGSTALGYLALANESTGGENTAVGRTTLGVLTTGTRNVGMGPCLQALTTATGNVAGGSEAFERLTTQNYNTGWGHWAGVYNRGSSNVAIGAFSHGQTLIDGVGNDASQNTFLGAYSGFTHNVGDNNVYLGFEAGGSNTDERNNCVAIGYRAKASQDFSFVLGSQTDAERVNYGFGGESYGSGVGVAFFKNAVTNASAAPTSGIILHSRDSSDGDGTLALFLEQDVEVVGTFTASHKVKVWINGTEYWLQLDAV